jgi:hypothetical protein
VTGNDRYENLRQALTESSLPATDDPPTDRERRGWHHQAATLEIAKDFIEAHDLPALVAVDAAGRAEQQQARWALYHFVDAIWQAPS